jgi:NADH-quinone oxidoreductase subunit C
MSTKLESLEGALKEALADKLQSIDCAFGEITIVVKSSDYLSAMQILRDDQRLQFSQLTDLCGMDYST